MSGCITSGRLRWLGGWLLLVASAIVLVTGLLGVFSAWRSVIFQWNHRAAGAADGVLIASVWFASSVPADQGFDVNSAPRTHPFVWWIEPDGMMQSCAGVVATQSINGFGVSSWTIMFVWWLPLLLGSTGVGAGYSIVTRARRRRREGVCVECGYSMAGLAAGAACPECGAEGSKHGTART